MPKYFENRVKHSPLILGHEFCGIVEEGSKNLIGKLVSMKPLLNCGKCESCKKGNINLCSNQKFYGSNLDGGMQEYITYPSKLLIDANILINEPVLATLIEPTANALHSIKMINDNFIINKQIGIVGKGVMGTLVYYILKFIYNIEEDNITFITKNETTKDNCFDYCFECSGTIEGINSAIKITNYKGKIIQVGIAYPEDFYNKDFNFDKLLRKEQLFQGSWQSNYKSDWLDAIIIINNNRKIFKELISAEFNLENVNEAFYYKKYIKENTYKIIIKVAK